MVIDLVEAAHRLGFSDAVKQKSIRMPIAGEEALEDVSLLRGELVARLSNLLARAEKAEAALVAQCYGDDCDRCEAVYEVGGHHLRSRLTELIERLRRRYEQQSVLDRWVMGGRSAAASIADDIERALEGKT